MKKAVIFLILVFFIHVSMLQGQKVSQNYTDIQKKIANGWNTWDYGSMLTQVLLPEGLALKVNFRQAFIGTPGDHDYFIDEFTTDTSDMVQPVAHSFDGSYTELIINNWKGNRIKVQTAALGKDVVILVTPMVNPQYATPSNSRPGSCGTGKVTWNAWTI